MYKFLTDILNEVYENCDIHDGVRIVKGGSRQGMASFWRRGTHDTLSEFTSEWERRTLWGYFAQDYSSFSILRKGGKLHEFALVNKCWYVSGSKLDDIFLSVWALVCKITRYVCRWEVAGTWWVCSSWPGHQCHMLTCNSVSMLILFEIERKIFTEH